MRIYSPAPYLYLPRVAARVRRIGFRATVAYFKNQGYTLDQALYLFAGRNTLTAGACTMPAITSPRSYAIPADESLDPVFWQRMADNAAYVARLAYIAGDYKYAVKAQRSAVRYAATARKEYSRGAARQ